MSADEVVALLDPDDDTGRVVGTAPRREVRARNLPHAATGVLLRDAAGRVLVHRRARTKDVWPGLPDCASGGVVLAGEDVDDAAARELAEELGLHGVRPTPVLRAWYADDVTHYLAHVYVASYDPAVHGEVTFADGEVEDAWWQPWDEVARSLADPSSPFVPDTRALLARLPGDPSSWPALP